MPENQTTEANDDMVEGYVDGLDLNAPEPSANRSHSYRHGFARARDDRLHRYSGSAAHLRQWAKEAMERDRNV